MNRRQVVRVLLFFTALAVGSVHAQTFPSKVVKLVVAFPPGGGGDILARVLADRMAGELGQSVIVENRPGGGAVVAYEFVARAPADGYTVLEVFPSFVINPAIRRGLSFDPLGDFKSIGQAALLPMALVVNPSLPAHTLQELVALARARPGDLSYGTPGPGTTQHLVGEMLRLATGIDIVHVPYQGGAAAASAVAGNHIAMSISNVTEAAPFFNGGKVRPIVVTTAMRAEQLPDVPTFREAGFPALETMNWIGFVVPQGTPAAAAARLNAALVHALADAAVQEKIKAQGMLPASGSAEEFAALLKSESTRFGAVAKAAKLQVD